MFIPDGTPDVGTVVKCEACGIKFTVKRYTKGKFCDAACKKRAQVKMKTVVCAGCGARLRRHRSELKRTGSSVCNRACQTKAVAIAWERVAELRAKGMSYRQIGAALGIGRTKAERIYKSKKVC